MLLLTPTDILRIVTSAAANIQVVASFVDAPYPATPSSNMSPDRQLTTITTAATTTVVAAPAALTRRNIKYLNISNNHATVSCQVGVELFDTTNAFELRDVTLLPGESLALTDDGEWHHRDAQSAEYAYTAAPNGNLGATGVLAETMPRETCPEVNTTVAVTGTLFLQAIRLTAGQLVSNISLCSATTGATTPTNYFAALYSGARALLARSADQTTTAFAANTYRTFAMLTAYRVPTSGLYYIGYMMAATTVATLKGGTAKTGGQLGATVPILHGTSTTGLTTTLPDPAGAISTGTASIYAAVS